MKNLLFIATCLLWSVNNFSQQSAFKLNKLEYFEREGVNVMVFQDIYPEGHQGGISIIQNGVRVVTDGDLLLDVIPGQWQPIPKPGQRLVDTKNNEIRMSLTFPDSSRNGKGFNPINYPDLYFNYKISVKPEGESIHITVDLDRALPKEYIGKVGFVIELYPAILFGKR